MHITGFFDSSFLADSGGEEQDDGLLSWMEASTTYLSRGFSFSIIDYKSLTYMGGSLASFSGSPSYRAIIPCMTLCLSFKQCLFKITGWFGCMNLPCSLIHGTLHNVVDLKKSLHACRLYIHMYIHMYIYIFIYTFFYMYCECT